MQTRSSVTPPFRIHGCLIGGAVGDALGAPIEFMDWVSIKSRFGEDGVTDYYPAYGRNGAITDDTQMTLFTAEGLIRAQRRFEYKGVCSPKDVIRNAYIRWMHTQGEPSKNEDVPVESGWLVTNAVLHQVRAPGATVIKEMRRLQRPEYSFADNNSKGCGGVMRVAPIGLIAREPFKLALEAAHFTHGHPTGYLSAGAFAMIINEIMNGEPLPNAIHNTLHVLSIYDDHQETYEAIKQAVNHAEKHPLAPESIEQLGQGWVAEEALAIALFCAIKAEDFSSGVLAAVNHSGDSDSTGSICGNLLGCLMGIESIPSNWIEKLEAVDVIEQLAHDFIHTFINDNQQAKVDKTRYPAY